MESDVRRVCHFDVDPIVAERPQPELPCQLDGGATLQRKSARVRETRQGLRRAKLVRRLSIRNNYSDPLCGLLL